MLVAVALADAATKSFWNSSDDQSTLSSLLLL